MFTLVTVFCSSFFSNMSHNSHSFEEKEVKKKALWDQVQGCALPKPGGPCCPWNVCSWATRKYYLFHTSRMLGSPVLQVQNTGPLHFFLEHSLAGYLLFFFSQEDTVFAFFRDMVILLYSMGSHLFLCVEVQQKIIF